VFHPEKIERQLATIGTADACYTNFDIIGPDGVLIEHVCVKPPAQAGMFRQICTRNLINGSSMMLRRDVFERIGYFREDLPVDVDGDMWLRMIGAGMSIAHLSEILLKYRRHGGQLSANRELMRATKDRVRAEAIERTVPEMAFPAEAIDIGGSATRGPLAAAYGHLGWAMSSQSLTLAAAAARRRALDVLQSTGG